jgi:hypothetical protein
MMTLIMMAASTTFNRTASAAAAAAAASAAAAAAAAALMALKSLQRGHRVHGREDAKAVLSLTLNSASPRFDRDPASDVLPGSDVWMRIPACIALDRITTAGCRHNPSGPDTLKPAQSPAPVITEPSNRLQKELREGTMVMWVDRSGSRGAYFARSPRRVASALAAPSRSFVAAAYAAAATATVVLDFEGVGDRSHVKNYLRRRGAAGPPRTTGSPWEMACRPRWTPMLGRSAFFAHEPSPRTAARFSEETQTTRS